MKILLISPYFPPEVGSAAHLYYELGKDLKERGHEVMVLTGLPRYHVIGGQKTYRRRPFVAENYDGMRVFRVFNLDIPWNIALLRGLDQFLSALSVSLAGIFLPPVDIMLVYSPPLPLAMSAFLLGLVRGVPAILNVQDIFPQGVIDLGILKNQLLIRFFRSIEAFLYRNFGLIIVHSEGNRNYILKRGAKPHQVTEIPNWVDTETIKPGARDNSVRRALGLQKNFIVSFAGIMSYSQNLDIVLESAVLLKDHQEIAFLLVGDGAEKPRLEKAARENRLNNVYFLPMQPKEEYLKILAASDLCLVTLRKEVKTPVVPSKILSIMAAGRPVLASLPLGGDAPKLITRAGCGISLPPDNPGLMANAILQLYQDSELRNKMGANGRRYAVKHLSLHAWVPRLENIFANIIERYQKV